MLDVSLFYENHAPLRDKHGKYVARRAAASWQPAPQTVPLAQPYHPVPGISATGSCIRSTWKIGDRLSIELGRFRQWSYK